MEVDYDIFATKSNLNSAGISFDVTPGTLKLSLTIDGWNFSSSSNHIRVQFIVNVQPSITSISETTSGNITTFTILSSNVLSTTIRMLQFGVSDNSTIAPVDFYINTTSSTSGDNSTIYLVLVLPYFNSSFHYDPDLSVTFLGGGGGDGGSSTDLYPLFALIAIIPIGLLMIAAVILAIFVVRKWLWRRLARHDEGGVQFDNMNF